jgi:PilZ domain-containing protein
MNLPITDFAPPPFSLPPAIERRRDVRVPADGHPARLEHFASIKILDLGAGGALVETSSFVAPEQHVPLTIEPGIAMTGEVTRCALVRIEWTAAVPRTVYQVGIRFDPPPPESRRKLVGLLEALCRLAPDAPLPTAVRIG